MALNRTLLPFYEVNEHIEVSFGDIKQAVMLNITSILIYVFILQVEMLLVGHAANLKTRDLEDSYSKYGNFQVHLSKRIAAKTKCL